jgi:hypothetical protein
MIPASTMAPRATGRPAPADRSGRCWVIRGDRLGPLHGLSITIDNQPAAIRLVGRPGVDAALLRAAAIFEQVRP